MASSPYFFTDYGKTSRGLYIQKSTHPVGYPDALKWMENHVNAMLRQEERERFWLLEHPALYTAGSLAKTAELIEKNTLPVFKTNRGGRFTYHGPGQRIGYLMVNLTRRHTQDVRVFITLIEEWIIQSIALFGVNAFRHPDYVGIWVHNSSGHCDKIAAIGIRLRRWVSFHGFSVNIAPNLAHFQGIIPCGIHKQDLGVTSLQALGVDISMESFDEALKSCCPF